MGQAFGGKKAAPFVKGGGRAKNSANDAKGNKKAAAKAALRASASKELSKLGASDIALSYEGFSKLKGQLAAKGATNPGALAAYIGRKKYGVKKFDKAATKGVKLGKKRK